MKPTAYCHLLFFCSLFLWVGAIISCSKVTHLRDVDEMDSSFLDTRSMLEMNSYSISEEMSSAFVALHYPDRKFELQPIVQDGDTLLFLCNFDDDGWILLAGDKRSRPILGESEKDHLFLDDAPEGIRVWIGTCCDDIKYLKYASDIQSNSYSELWDALFPKRYKRTNGSIKGNNNRTDDCKWCVFKWVYPNSSSSSTIISHMTDTQWGLGSPWNTKLPMGLDTLANSNKCSQGSAAVAIAQLLYYTHFHIGKPNGLYHTIQVSQPYIVGSTTDIGFSRGDYVPNSNRWDAMPIDSMPPGTPLYAEDLMLDIGNRIGMQYSGVYCLGFPSLSALATYYSLSGSMDDYQENIVRNCLENEMPVIITAYGRPNVGAHTWLIEGIYRTVIEYEMAIQIEYSDQWMYANEYFESFDELRQYYHTDNGGVQFVPWGSRIDDYWLMNWGLDGRFYEGHYSVSSNASWEGRSYDKTIYYGFE